ncbi:MAG: sulfur transferase domain-containing protein [Acetobacteraceae bacterium]
MWEQIELSRGVKVGRRPPSEPELAALHRDGVRSVIDLRTDAEPRGIYLAPAEEAEVVRAYGMESIRVPVSAAQVDKGDLDRVGEALRNAPKPLLIHCASGKRACMLALVHTAIETGTPGAEMLEMARHLDVVFGDPAQQLMYADYVDQHEIRPDALLRREDALRVDGRPVPLLPEATRRLAEQMREETRRHLTVIERRRSRTSVRPARRRFAWRGGARFAPRIRLSTAAALAGAAMLIFDRRLRVPMLLAAGVAAGRAMAMLRGRPPAPLPPEDPALEREIADLQRQVRRLRETA